MNSLENSVANGTLFADNVIVEKDSGTMETMTRLRMKFRYRKEWREKYVTLIRLLLRASENVSALCQRVSPF